MWHILSAKPGSTIALGFKEALTKEQLRSAIEDKRVEDLLNWVPVKADDTYYAEAGTVHAIGGGITLCEIQQNSDVTYRLYDYNRGRELHLEKGIAVSSTLPYQGARNFRSPANISLPVCSSLCASRMRRWRVDRDWG